MLYLNNNATRMLTGLIVGTLALLCLIEGKLALLALLTAVFVLGAKEYVKILNNKGFYPSMTMIYLTQILLLLHAVFNNFEGALTTLTFCVIGAFMWILFRGRQPYIANVATTVLGMIYCGWLPLHLSFLRHLHCERFEDGLVFLVMLLISVILKL